MQTCWVLDLTLHQASSMCTHVYLLLTDIAQLSVLTLHAYLPTVADDANSLHNASVLLVIRLLETSGTYSRIAHILLGLVACYMDTSSPYSPRDHLHWKDWQHADLAMPK